MISKLAPYAKFVVAVAGAIVITAAAFADGSVDDAEGGAIVAAWATALGVFGVTNAKKPGEE